VKSNFPGELDLLSKEGAHGTAYRAGDTVVKVQTPTGENVKVVEDEIASSKRYKWRISHRFQTSSGKEISV
jgi:hypothetical protein